jgi:integrase
MSQIKQISIPHIPDLVPKIDLATIGGACAGDCLIHAKNDLEATAHWLALYEAKKTTFKSYRRESVRFLLWCIYEIGKPLKDLKIDDLQSYFNFLQNPPKAWMASQINALDHVDGCFLKGISAKSAKYSITIVNSLLNYLVEANYLKNNPLKLAKKSMSFAKQDNSRKYEVWSKILAEDEWAAILQAINAMPSNTHHEIDLKMRTKFLFALLYFLGLRINEVVTHCWGDFKLKDGLWWMVVTGKGDKLGHIPVNDELLNYIKEYRLYLELEPFPQEYEKENFIISKYSRKPYKIRTLYNLVKSIGEVAASYFPEQPLKQEKLRDFSPHSLRHLSASHQAGLGIPMNMIKDNLRHASINTTQIYVHSDDLARHNAIQQLAIESLQEDGLQNEEKSILKITIEKINSINIENSFVEFVKAIEGVAFKNIKFIPVNSLKKLLKEAALLKRIGNNLIFCYEIDSRIKENSASIVKSIAREADIRLLTVSVKFD